MKGLTELIIKLFIDSKADPYKSFLSTKKHLTLYVIVYEAGTF